jgi:alanine dehydrogenase
MRIGIPRELKPLEGRVGLIPAAAAELVRHGHQVFIEKNAGIKSGYSDENFRSVGVEVLNTAADVYGKAEMIV